jgi:FSR family fosmidomycin resistance protein-like MFS transporter
VFSLAAGAGSLLGGLLAPRLGRRTVLVGSLLVSVVPLLAVPQLAPGSLPFFAAAATAGTLLYMNGPVTVVFAQDLTPHAPAVAAGMVLGVAIAVAGALYVALGWIQQVVGLTAGMSIGFALVVPAAVIAFTVLLRHPETRR